MYPQGLVGEHSEQLFQMETTEVHQVDEQTKGDVHSVGKQSALRRHEVWSKHQRDESSHEQYAT